MYKKLYCILAFSLLVVLFCDEIAWHVQNKLLPTDDAATYAQTAIQKYQTFSTQGLREGGRFFYWFRNPRQMLFAECAVPFLFLSDGNILTGITMPLIFFYAALMLFTYLILRHHLTSSGSLAGTAIIMSLHWVVNLSHVFMSENAMLAALSAAIYFGQASKTWTSWENSTAFGVALGLAFCIRPVELSAVCFMFCSYLLIKAWYKKTVFTFDLVACFFFCASIGCLAWSLFLNPPLINILFVVGMPFTFTAVYMLAVFLKKETNKQFFGWVLLTVLIPVLWWLPKVKEFYGYASSAMFGSVIRVNPSHLDLGQSTIFYLNLLNFYRIPVLLLLSFFSCITLFFQKKKDVPNASLLLLGLLSFWLIIAITPLLVGSDPRRCFPGAYLLILGMVSFAVSPKIPFYGFRCFILISLAIAQVLMVTIDTLPYHYIKNTWVNEQWRWYVTPPYSRDDPDTAVYVALQGRIPEGSKVVCASIALYSNRDRIFNHQALNLLAVSKHSRTYYGMPWDFKTVTEGYKSIDLEAFNYILLDPNTKTSVDYAFLKKYNAQEMLTDDLISRYKRNDWSNVNWEPFSRFYAHHRELVLLRRKSRW